MHILFWISSFAFDLEGHGGTICGEGVMARGWVREFPEVRITVAWQQFFSSVDSLVLQR